jgi:hypothetical protein
MPTAGRPIPQPTRYEPAAPPPDVMARFQPPPPSATAVTQVVTERGPELAVILKRCYVYDAHGRCRLADEQAPLAQESELYEPLAPDVAPSSKTLPEILGFKTGTDLVIQGSARPSRPTPSTTVSVEIGTRRHWALVSGRRVCDFHQGRLTFTPAEPFLDMPLRYENAYGGRDHAAEERFLEELRRTAKPEELRACGAVLDFLVGGIHPLMYPRNRFGKGYVLDDRRESIQGRELPNLEWPNDVLTPERLVVRHPLQWSRQPIPMGFDYLDPYSFPRCAMLGLPPAAMEDLTNCPEVARRLIPAGYCLGNAVTATSEQLPDLLHPSASRCASLGLWLPWLKGDEEFCVEGMDPAAPVIRIGLPRERPVFHLKGIDGSALSLPGHELNLVQFSVKTRTLSLVWVGRSALTRPLMPGETVQLAADLRLDMKKM